MGKNWHSEPKWEDVLTQNATFLHSLYYFHTVYVNYERVGWSAFLLALSSIWVAWILKPFHPFYYQTCHLGEKMGSLETYGDIGLDKPEKQELGGKIMKTQSHVSLIDRLLLCILPYKKYIWGQSFIGSPLHSNINPQRNCQKFYCKIIF